jgi:hypothetical protein
VLFIYRVGFEVHTKCNAMGCVMISLVELVQVARFYVR